MSRDKVLHKRYVQKVVHYYKNLDACIEFGVKKHTNAWCIAKTADHFDKRPKTIKHYIYS
mgnify:CR=1 FL=1